MASPTATSLCPVLLLLAASTLPLGAARHAASLESHAAGQLRGRTARHQAKEPHEAGWFGGFDQMESTYDDEGNDAYLSQNPARMAETGFQFGYSAPLKEKEIKGHQWFHESPSAGDVDAWQTHYPAVSGSIAGNRNVRANPWRETPEGWVQDYNPSQLTTKRGSKPGRYEAEWFDSSVLNFDGFGRRQLPYPSAPRRAEEAELYAEAWTERAVNTSIACAAIGCTANATLTAYDPSTEEAQNCQLNIGVHPTDYDDSFGRENVDQWVVNGFLVKALCDPMTRGCNTSAARPLYSCVNQFGIDHLIDSAGALLISGTINRLVDECPYEGNLLSAVAMVTCLVRPIPVVPTPPAEQLRAETQPQVARTAAANVSLTCSTPGCNASTVLDLDPAIAMLGGSCLMNITVAQTDFDDNLGLPEQLDFIAMEGVGNLTLSQPSRNPCNLRYNGTTPTAQDLQHTVVTNLNVTSALLAMPAGSISLSGKISDQVDECASNGKLLDAMVNVVCQLPEATATAVSVPNATSNATANSTAAPAAAAPAPSPAATANATA